MRKVNINLDDIKKQILELKGKEVNLEINFGRKKIRTLNAVIEHIYPSLFTIKLHPDTEDLSTTKTSYSYFDVLCGDVKIL